jgi:hypothetical protein
MLTKTITIVVPFDADVQAITDAASGLAVDRGGSYDISRSTMTNLHMQFVPPPVIDDERVVELDHYRKSPRRPHPHAPMPGAA